MTIEDLKGDLTRLQDDAARVASDSQNLIKDFGKQMETVEDEIVAAEILATNNTVEGIGIVFESVILLRDVGTQQIMFLIDDGRETLEKLQTAETSEERIVTLFNHLGRCVNHVSSGFESVCRMVGNELDEISGTVDNSWSFFSRLLSADWSDAGQKNT